MKDPKDRIFKDWPNPMGLGSQAAQESPVKIDIKIEPWMVGFVKGRHSEEEWDGFFVYLKAGPVRRWFIRMGSYLYWVFPFRHRR